MTDPPFDRGGYLPAGPRRVVLDVAECIVGTDTGGMGRWVCLRTDLAHRYAAHGDERPLRASDGVSPACSDDCDKPLGHEGVCRG